MKLNLVIILTWLFCFSNTKAQIVEKNLAIATAITFKSEILEDQRELLIYLPENYTASEIEYPVLYILDGQRYFLHGVSLQKSFVHFKQTPGFIIVGISQTQSDRNIYYTRDSKKYLSFIENEVVRFIEDKYRTSKERMVFGWAFGGGFVVQCLISKPNLFDAYFAASPFPIEDKLKSLDSLLLVKTVFDKLLFLASETTDGTVIKGMENLNKLLVKSVPEKFNWTFKRLEGEEHRSTAFTTLYHGIRKYYEFFPELQFNNLSEFRDAGGLTYVNNYYYTRSRLFGFSTRLSDWTMFSLTRNAMREKDIAQFEIFINEFSKANFLERINLSRALSIANFCKENKQYDQAIKIYELLVLKHPKEDRPLIGLGDTYKKMNEKEKALQYYEKANEINKN